MTSNEQTGGNGKADGAAPPDSGDECIGCSHSLSAHDRREGDCIYCNCPAFKGAAPAPPAWLRDAVLAALPVDGTTRSYDHIWDSIEAPRNAVLFDWSAMPDHIVATLAALVSSGEIEAGEQPETWRRWGVPEGWAWGTHNKEHILLEADKKVGHERATAEDNGSWIVWEECFDGVPMTNGEATPPILAALRACWERDVFAAVPKPAHDAAARIRERLSTMLAKGPRKAVDMLLDMVAGGAPEGFALPDLRAQLVAIGARRVYAGSGEQWEVGTVPDPIADVTPAPHFDGPATPRAEQVRTALLAALSRAPITGRSHVLAALDAAGLTPAATGEEAARAAREVGAVVDGPRWSLPAMPPGWGWRHVNGADLLTRMGAVRANDDAVAIVQRDHVGNTLGWKLLPNGEQWWAPSVEEAQIAALAAARRAGLFAPTAPAVEVTGDGGPVVLPAVTAKGGEAPIYPAPHGPLDAAVLAILATASCAEITAHLKAWGASLVAEARRGASDTIAAVGPTSGSVQAVPIHTRRTIDAAGVLRVYGDDGTTVVHEERVGAFTPADAAAEARRERDDARTQMAIEAARADRAEREASELAAAIHQLAARRNEAERERDDARAKLAALQAGLDGLRTWATGARGGAR